MYDKTGFVYKYIDFLYRKYEKIDNNNNYKVIVAGYKFNKQS